jgi:hypothetical protein
MMVEKKNETKMADIETLANAIQAQFNWTVLETSDFTSSLVQKGEPVDEVGWCKVNGIKVKARRGWNGLNYEKSFRVGNFFVANVDGYLFEAIAKLMLGESSYEDARFVRAKHSRPLPQWAE